MKSSNKIRNIKIYKDYEITLLQAKQIIVLLETNYSFIDSLLLLDDKYQCYQEQLLKGKQLQEIIKINANNHFMHHFAFLLQFMPLNQAIQNSIKLCEFQNEIKQKLLKAISYPLLILMLALSLMIIFLFYLLPIVKTTFIIEDHNLIRMLNMMEYLCIFLIIVMTIVLMVIILSLISLKFRFYIMKILSKYMKIIKVYCSYIYAKYLYEFMNYHIPTIQMICYLKQINIYWLKQMAIDLDNRLKQGKDYESLMMEMPLFDDLWKQNLKIAIHSSQKVMIERYFIQTSFYFDKFFKKMTIIMQLIVYGFVGCIVFLVFQVFMIPLSMLETF